MELVAVLELAVEEEPEVAEDPEEVEEVPVAEEVEEVPVAEEVEEVPVAEEVEPVPVPESLIPSSMITLFREIKAKSTNTKTMLNFVIYFYNIKSDKTT